MSNGKFVVFEGHDGAGKTSVIRESISILDNDIVIYQQGFPHKSPVDTWIDQHASSSLYYGRLLFNDIFNTIPKLRNGNVILQDRYVQTVDTYAPDNLYRHNTFLRSLLDPFFLKPDAYIFVTATQEVIQSRLRQKNEERQGEYHQILLENPKIIERRLVDYQKIFERQTAPKLLLDTSTLSVEESAMHVITFLKERNIC